MIKGSRDTLNPGIAYPTTVGVKVVRENVHTSILFNLILPHNCPTLISTPLIIRPTAKSPIKTQLKMSSMSTKLWQLLFTLSLDIPRHWTCCVLIIPSQNVYLKFSSTSTCTLTKRSVCFFLPDEDQIEIFSNILVCKKKRKKYASNPNYSSVL